MDTASTVLELNLYVLPRTFAGLTTPYHIGLCNTICTPRSQCLPPRVAATSDMWARQVVPHLALKHPCIVQREHETPVWLVWQAALGGHNRGSSRDMLWWQTAG